MRRLFENIRQGPEETPLMYKERFVKALEASLQLGLDTTGETVPSFSQSDIALRYINNLDPARYSTLTTELENDIAKGTDSYPTTLLEAFNLTQKWKTSRPRSMETSKSLGVYLNQHQKGRRNSLDAAEVETAALKMAEAEMLGAKTAKGKSASLENLLKIFAANVTTATKLDIESVNVQISMMYQIAVEMIILLR